MNLFRSLRQTLFPSSQPISYLTPKIPSEILDAIFAILSIPDQICLALSCKRLYAHYLSLIEAKRKPLHQLLPRERRKRLCPHNESKNRPRLQLLHQLQNKRWKYCAGCWNLHPPSAWSSLHLPGRARPTSRCKPYAGAVDICPCLTISASDKLHLIKTLGKLKHAEGEPPKGLKDYSSHVTYQPPGAEIPGSLFHACVVTAHPLAKVEIGSAICVYEGLLLVVNLYMFQISKDVFTLPADIRTQLLCPHKKFGKWLRRFFDTAGVKFPGWNKNNGFDEAECCCAESPASLRYFEISTVRALGYARWSDKLWKRNSRR